MIESSVLHCGLTRFWCYSFCLPQTVIRQQSHCNCNIAEIGLASVHHTPLDPLSMVIFASSFCCGFCPVANATACCLLLLPLAAAAAACCLLLAACCCLLLLLAAAAAAACCLLLLAAAAAMCCCHRRLQPCHQVQVQQMAAFTSLMLVLLCPNYQCTANFALRL